jgi:hypothetical protein
LLCKDFPAVGEVLAGVGGVGLDADHLGRYAEGDGVLAVVDGLAAREPFDGGGCVGAGEHDVREQALLVQLGGVGGDAEVVAAQADADLAGPQLVVHVVVGPQGLDVVSQVCGKHGGRHARAPYGSWGSVPCTPIRWASSMARLVRRGSLIISRTRMRESRW